MSAKVERTIEEIETLSEKEWNQLVGYLERREELGRLKLSEESFAEDWNSEEDSIYDRLRARRCRVGSLPAATTGYRLLFPCR